MHLETAPLVTENLRFVGHWLAHVVDGPADWLGKSLEVRPCADAVLARCSVTSLDGGESVGWVLPLDHGIAEAVVEMQAAMATPGGGAWVVAAVDVDPGGSATLRVDATGVPAELVAGRPLSAPELWDHLTRFPRDVVEPWMIDLLAADQAARPA